MNTGIEFLFYVLLVLASFLVIDNLISKIVAALFRLQDVYVIAYMQVCEKVGQMLRLRYFEELTRQEAIGLITKPFFPFLN